MTDENLERKVKAGRRAYPLKYIKTCNIYAGERPQLFYSAGKRNPNSENSLRENDSGV